MKITAILGSPRAGGNTDILAANVLDGARDAGLETVSIALRNLKIHPCIGCDKCWSKDRPCVFEDDMPYHAFAESGILLFATPVYWYAPTAIMKAFMDRMVPLNRPQGSSMKDGKKAILVTAYEEESTEAAEPLVKAFELSFAYLGWELVNKLIVPGVGPKGAVSEKTGTLKSAYLIGKWLAGS